SACIEVGAGLSFLIVPSVSLTLLLGLSVAVPEVLLVGRITGAALLAIGVASWIGRGDIQGRAQTASISGLRLYDVAAAVLLGYAGLALSLAGVLLWPAVGLHSALAVWCLACLWRKPPGGTGADPGNGRP